MAFSSGQVSTEGNAVKRYTGVASVFVRGINPNKEELEKFFDRELDNDPEYVSTVESGSENIPQVRIDILVEADPDKYEDSLKSRVTFFLRKRHVFTRDNSKVRVIDKYGYPGWATKEELASHAQLKSANGKNMRISTSYRPAYEGEVELIDFLKCYLNIPEALSYVNGEWTSNKRYKPEDCEACLEHIEDFFKGDVKELKNIISYQPNNKVKVLFGVRTANDGKQYQTSFTRMFLKNNVNDYSKLDAEVKRVQESGALSTSEFTVGELKEYTVTPTDFEQIEPVTDTPWG